MLTCATYKFAIATMMPSVSYLTIVDKYVMFNALLIFFLVFEGALVGYFDRKFGPDVAEMMDFASLLAYCGMIVMLHLCFGVYYRKAIFRTWNMAEKTSATIHRRSSIVVPADLASTPRGSSQSPHHAGTKHRNLSAFTHNLYHNDHLSGLAHRGSLAKMRARAISESDPSLKHLN